jgi:hypothetical protein
MTRRIVPFVILLPLVVGYLALIAVLSGGLFANFAFALVMVVTIIPMRQLSVATGVCLTDCTPVNARRRRECGGARAYSSVRLCGRHEQ